MAKEKKSAVKKAIDAAKDAVGLGETEEETVEEAVEANAAAAAVADDDKLFEASDERAYAEWIRRGYTPQKARMLVEEGKSPFK